MGKFAFRWCVVVLWTVVFFLNHNLYSMIVESKDSLSERRSGYEDIYPKYSPIAIENKMKSEGDGIIEVFFYHKLHPHVYNLYQIPKKNPEPDVFEILYERGPLIKSFLEFKKIKSNKIKQIRKIELVKTDSTSAFYPKPKEYPYTIAQWNKSYMKNFLFLNFLDKIDELYSTSVSWCPYKKNRLLPVVKWFVDNSGDFSYGGGVKFATGPVAVELYDSVQTMMSNKTYEQGMTLLGYIGYEWILSFNIHRSTPKDIYGNFDYSYTPSITYMYMKDTFMFSPYVSITYTKRYMGLETEKYYSLGLYAGI